METYNTHCSHLAFLTNSKFGYYSLMVQKGCLHSLCGFTESIEGCMWCGCFCWWTHKIFLLGIFMQWPFYDILTWYKFVQEMFQFSSVTQSCPTLWDPMNRSTPGLPVHHQLPELTQTHVHRVSDAIQPSHPVFPFSSCPQSLPASESFPMSQLIAWGGQSTGVSALASFLPKKSQGWSPSECLFWSVLLNCIPIYTLTNNTIGWTVWNCCSWEPKKLNIDNSIWFVLTREGFAPSPAW